MTSTQQRAVLQRQIWQIANDVRGAVDGWGFKQYVLAPKSKADFSFVLHALSYLSSKGRAAIVCFPGIFYRGGAEQKIRKYLIDNNYVETVISLASNLFYGTTIAKIDQLRADIDTIVAEIDLPAGRGSANVSYLCITL